MHNRRERDAPSAWVVVVGGVGVRGGGCTVACDCLFARQGADPVPRIAGTVVRRNKKGQGLSAHAQTRTTMSPIAIQTPGAPPNPSEKGVSSLCCLHTQAAVVTAAGHPCTAKDHTFHCGLPMPGSHDRACKHPGHRWGLLRTAHRPGRATATLDQQAWSFLVLCTTQTCRQNTQSRAVDNPPIPRVPHKTGGKPTQACIQACSGMHTAACVSGKAFTPLCRLGNLEHHSGCHVVHEGGAWRRWEGAGGVCMRTFKGRQTDIGS